MSNKENHADIINADDCHADKTCLSQYTLIAQSQMRSENQLCDACICLDDGVCIQVHRIIMCTVCDYFRALFTSPINKEMTTNVHIKGVSSTAMQAMVDFAYSRLAAVSDENVAEILTVAHYFGIRRLEDLCCNYIKTMLNSDNCIWLWLHLRSNVSLHALDDYIKIYILRNFLEIIKKSDKLLEVSFEKFYEIINDDRLNVKAEEPIWEYCLRWIDFDRANRKKYITKLLASIRLGLMNVDYFLKNVKDHTYVERDKICNQIVVKTLAFMHDLSTITDQVETFKTPKIAMPRLPHDVIFAIGGWSCGQARSYVEVYDTRADRWICLPNEDSQGARAYHGCVVVGHKIYCIGGYNGTEYFNLCTVFDAVTKAWMEIAPMHSCRCYVSAVQLNGKVYALGGHDGVERLNTMERYDPITNQWTMMPDMSSARSDASATVYNNKIFIAGGFNGMQCMSTAEIYDPTTNEWSNIEGMLFRRSGLSIIAFNNYIYAIGGFNGTSRMASVEQFDPIANTWTLVKPMNSARSNFAVEMIDDLIFVIGGYDGRTTVNLTECYNPELNDWLEATNTTYTRSALSACVVSGLPNIIDYTYRNREYLLEERRLFNSGQLALTR